MTVADNCVVSIEYTLTDEEGEVLDSTSGDLPLDYLHGAENIVPGLEKALTGKSEGDTISLTLQPEDAWGEYDESLVLTVPLAMFEGAEEVVPGMEFQGESDDGELHLMTVLEINGDQVLVDANHPLAGDILHYEVTIRGVRAATADELEHGHPHSEGSCSH